MAHADVTSIKFINAGSYLGTKSVLQLKCTINDSIPAHNFEITSTEEWPTYRNRRTRVEML